MCVGCGHLKRINIYDHLKGHTPKHCYGFSVVRCKAPQDPHWYDCHCQKHEYPLRRYGCQKCLAQRCKAKETHEWIRLEAPAEVYACKVCRLAVWIEAKANV